jgi:hypothetical protein
MKAWRTATGIALVLGVVATLASTQAFALFQGTPEEQAACKRDAIRYCREASATGDSLRVLACLQSNRAKLAKACLKVLESHGQ